MNKFPDLKCQKIIKVKHGTATDALQEGMGRIEKKL